MKINNLIFVFIITLFISNTNDLYSANKEIHLSHINNDKTVELDDFDCRTYTVGINVFFAYIETTVTVCCQFTGHWICTEIDARNAGSKKITVDLTQEFSKYKYDKSKLEYIEISKSSTVDFDGQKIQIKKGKYKISKDNIVNLDYVLIK